ncbi:MAG: hypothetical protein FD160_1404, partial [Caulobacteraceae bacterium]
MRTTKGKGLGLIGATALAVVFVAPLFPAFAQESSGAIGDGAS